MSEYGEITIGNQTIDVEDLYDQYSEDGKIDIDAVIAEECKGMSESDIEKLKEELTAQFEELREYYNELEEELDGEKDEWKDLNDDVRVEIIEEELDELDAIDEFVRKELEDQFDESFNEFLDLNFVYDATEYPEVAVTMSTLMETHGGDTGQVEFDYTFEGTGTSEAYFGEQEEALTDLDGDGLITYKDEEYRTAQEASSMYEGVQNVFLNLGSYTLMRLDSRGIEDGYRVLYIEARDPATGNIVKGTIRVGEGTNIYLDANSNDNIPESVLRGLDQDDQKYIYIRDDLKSVYENLNPLSQDEKLSYIENFEDVISESTFDQVFNSFASGSNRSEVEKYTREVLKKLYGTMTDPDGLRVTEVWSEIIHSDLSGLSDLLISDILACVIMSVAVRGGQAYFEHLFGSTVPSLIESAFLSDDKLSETEKMLSMFLELHSTGAGQYAGANFLDVDGAGAVFYRDADNDIAIYDEQWQDKESTIAAFELYKEALNQVEWLADDGVVDPYIDNLQEQIDYEKELEEEGKSEVMTDEYLKALKKAKTAYHPKGGNNKFDGISQSDFDAYVSAGIQLLIDNAEKYGEEFTMELAAQTLLEYLDSLKEDAGDIAAGIIYALDKKAPGVLASMIEAYPDFKSRIKTLIAGEKVETPVHEDALKILDEY